MLRRLVLGLAAGAIVAVALLMVLERMAAAERAAERRALIARNAELTREVLAPGSTLACLEAEAGESVAKACEAAVFATPQSVAAATGFVAERLKLIEAAHVLARGGQGDVLAAFVTERRAIERDRFGIAAHVLARRYGCSAETCAAFAMLGDTGALKFDLAKRPFEALVARYERGWGKPAEEHVPMAAAPAAPPAEAKAETSAPPPAAAASGTDALARAEPPVKEPHPLDRRWKLPSADSIPAISIIAPEPKLPRAEPKPAEAPLPPKRPQAQAVPAAEDR